MPRVTKKGQVTIPRQIRDVLNIQTGDEITFILETDKVVLKKKGSRIENMIKYVGYLKHLDGKEPDTIVEELRGSINDQSH